MDDTEGGGVTGKFGEIGEPKRKFAAEGPHYSLEIRQGLGLDTTTLLGRLETLDVLRKTSGVKSMAKLVSCFSFHCFFQSFHTVTISICHTPSPTPHG